MSKFLDTTGNAVLSIGICDRCQQKFPLGELKPDPNAPGLRVCVADRDVFDPWRLPAPSPDRISVPNTRPDQSVLPTSGLGINAQGDVIASAIPTNLAVIPSST